MKTGDRTTHTNPAKPHVALHRSRRANAPRTPATAAVKRKDRYLKADKLPSAFRRQSLPFAAGRAARIWAVRASM